MSRRYALPLACTIVATVAACSDAPLAPTPANTGLTPSAPALSDGVIVSGGGIGRPTPVTVTLSVSSQGGGSATGTTVKFTTNTGASNTVVDNGAGDGDNRAGFYKVTMPKAISYTATVVAMPDDFSPDSTSKTVSAFVTPTLVSMGDLMLLMKPGIYVSLWYKGALAPGQKIRVTGPNGYDVTMIDGTPSELTDLGKPPVADGKFSFSVPSTGTYKVCALSSPELYWGADCMPAYPMWYFIQVSTTLTYEQKWFVPKF